MLPKAAHFGGILALVPVPKLKVIRALGALSWVQLRAILIKRRLDCILNFGVIRVQTGVIQSWIPIILLRLLLLLAMLYVLLPKLRIILLRFPCIFSSASVFILFWRSDRKRSHVMVASFLNLPYLKLIIAFPLLLNIKVPLQQVSIFLTISLLLSTRGETGGPILNKVLLVLLHCFILVVIVWSLRVLRAHFQLIN